jgi:class 3 adenylate cyclase
MAEEGDFDIDEASRSSKELLAETPRGNNAPRNQVRNLNRAILATKCLLAFLLISAAGSLAGLVHKFVRESEKERFASDFAFVSKYITEALITDTSYIFELGQSTAVALSLLMKTSNTTQLNFALSIAEYRSLTLSGTKAAYYATWNPLLRNDEDRRQFETMVTSKESEGYFIDDTTSVCHLCGDENLSPSTPDVVVPLAGIGEYACGLLYQAGLDGLVSGEICPLMTKAVVEKCSCATTDSSATKNQTTSERKPSEGLYRVADNKTLVTQSWTGGPYLPMWMDSSVFGLGNAILYDHLSHPKSLEAVASMLQTGNAQVTEMYNNSEPTFYSVFHPRFVDEKLGPQSVMYSPVHSPTGPEIVGAVSLPINWFALLRNAVPSKGIFVRIVIENTCGQIHTYRVKDDGFNLIWLGEGDLHDHSYDHMMQRTSYDDFDTIRLSSASPESNDQDAQGHCNYRFAVYPTTLLEDQYITDLSWIYSVAVLAIFLFTSAVFLVYDHAIRRRQEKLAQEAKQSDDIVSSLFPQNVRERLYDRAAASPPLLGDGTETESSSKANGFLTGTTQASVFGSEPIADLYPSCTVLFMDIANFTAWSSEREASQVFVLLENLYHAYDKIGSKLGIFKVETIGDSYVAVCGLPTPRTDHAVVMTRFACMCLEKMRALVSRLEVTLGPSTGELEARCGLHSGPVTAGVLRGAKARFQLFGDTVNTASRMESSSLPNRIHASEQTINLLIKANKGAWILPRDEKVHLKGKGTLQTYWLDPRNEHAYSVSSRTPSLLQTRIHGPLDNDMMALDERMLRTERLIDWNVQVLADLLSKVVSKRNAVNNISGNRTFNQGPDANYQEFLRNTCGLLVIDEITEIISLPPFDPQVQSAIEDTDLPTIAKDQLREYVSNIAHAYKDVPFHNFEHASHVIMSATKLMKRIMSPEGIDCSVDGIVNEKEQQLFRAERIHEVTYGLSSDPLALFAVVFSALIHDVDHTGLTNKELVDMQAPVALAYRQQSVAEQNSVAVAWAALMQDEYADLRSCIYTSDGERARFRELVVDAVLATDIADKELGTLRKNRWEQAFAETRCQETSQIDKDRKATIVLEHILQASDVCHTMQHWHTYQKFNSRLFEERYIAYKKGVAGENPPWVGWYNGELWFFDNYIIPLAKKLHDCGVFGVSYHEYLNYAVENRNEWERKGVDIVECLRLDVEQKYSRELLELASFQ